MAKPADLEIRSDINRYTRCYCEENVYKLGLEILGRLGAGAALFAVFVSNRRRSVAVWRQRSGEESQDGLVVWDYHVILVESKAGGEAVVWDLDSSLPFPCQLPTYCLDAFRSEIGGTPVNAKYRPKFRVVPMQDYIDWFASDRRHMRGDAEGAWLSPPPIWPCLRGVKATAAGIGHNLDVFWTVEKGDMKPADEGAGSEGRQGKYGVVCDLEELQRPGFLAALATGAS